MSCQTKYWISQLTTLWHVQAYRRIISYSARNRISEFLRLCLLIFVDKVSFGKEYRKRISLYGILAFQPGEAMPKVHFTNDQICIKQLEHSLKIIARIVALYGETYLPIFNRLHAELTKASENEGVKALALQIALSYNEGR